MKKSFAYVSSMILLVSVFVLSAYKPQNAGPSASGEGSLDLPYMNGIAQHFSFHANTAADGTISGTFESRSRGQGTRVHGNITCMNILPDGKTAILQGIVTQTIENDFGIEVGSLIYFKVRDNGEGSNADPDQFSDYFAPTANFNCTNLNVALNPISGGNIQVRP